MVTPSFLGTEPEKIEAALRDFYLVVLRWDGEHGGVDGAPPPEGGAAEGGEGEQEWGLWKPGQDDNANE